MLVPCKMQEVLAAGEKLTEAWTSRGALWGAAVDAGTLLRVRLQVGVHGVRSTPTSYGRC